MVFADEEVTLERLQIERDAAERRLIDYVLERLSLWQRGRVRAIDPNIDPEQRDSAELAAIAAAVELDVLTDGWFSQAIGRKRRATRSPQWRTGESRGKPRLAMHADARNSLSDLQRRVDALRGSL